MLLGFVFYTASTRQTEETASNHWNLPGPWRCDANSTRHRPSYTVGTRTGFIAGAEPATRVGWKSAPRDRAMRNLRQRHLPLF